MRLGACTSPDVRRLAPCRLLLPLGATEQHGPHLPLETDTLIATALADAAAGSRPAVAVAPALPYGASGEHAGFPGTLSLGQAAVEMSIVELVRSADGFAGVTLVSWHGGNAEPVARAVARLRGEGREVHAWEPALSGGDAHAGRIETSLMLAIAPGRVGHLRPLGATRPVAQLMPVLREHGVAAVSPNGVLGDAREATRAEGEALLGALTADLGAFLDATRPAGVAG
ncbi:MAG TPA: mycofactocin biosynthesis peptidyl-dipeptidase MftE [Solirubrobacteraceae bacterium]|nr:mycofactocin biosynthesis peptidyl-dipeptidase MftE [Solirubrobacteraceae bacterium]